MKRLLAIALLVTLSTPALAQECPPDGGSPLAPVAEAARGWNRYDAQTVRLPDGRVDHRASAAANRAGVREEWVALTTRDKQKRVEDLMTGVPVLGLILAIPLFPVAVLQDTLDFAIAPVLIGKHAADAAVHYVLSIGQPKL